MKSWTQSIQPHFLFDVNKIRRVCRRNLKLPRFVFEEQCRTLQQINKQTILNQFS